MYAELLGALVHATQEPFATPLHPDRQRPAGHVGHAEHTPGLRPVQPLFHWPAAQAGHCWQTPGEKFPHEAVW